MRTVPVHNSEDVNCHIMLFICLEALVILIHLVIFGFYSVFFAWFCFVFFACRCYCNLHKKEKHYMQKKSIKQERKILHKKESKNTMVYWECPIRDIKSCKNLRKNCNISFFPPNLKIIYENAEHQLGHT